MQTKHQEKNMNTTTKWIGIVLILSAALFLALPASRAGVEKTQQSPNGTTNTKIRMNGLSSDTFLFDADTNTNGFLNVGRDEIAGTTQLDFSYATPDTVNLEIVYLIQGSGEIPNSAFTINSTTAHLTVTTPFPSHSCVVNFVTAEYDCDPGPAITFDLTWTKDGYASIHEKTQRSETFGPLTTKFKGEYESVSAKVNGTWTGHTASDLFGNLVDSKGHTNLREITLEANP